MPRVILPGPGPPPPRFAGARRAAPPAIPRRSARVLHRALHAQQRLAFRHGRGWLREWRSSSMGRSLARRCLARGATQRAAPVRRPLLLMLQWPITPYLVGADARAEIICRSLGLGGLLSTSALNDRCVRPPSFSSSMQKLPRRRHAQLCQWRLSRACASNCPRCLGGRRVLGTVTTGRHRECPPT